MNKIKEVLTKKVGPLPLGVWLLAVGGGLGVAAYWRAHSAAQAADAATTSDYTTAGDGAQGGNTSTNPGAGNLAGDSGTDGSGDSTSFDALSAQLDDGFAGLSDALGTGMEDLASLYGTSADPHQVNNGGTNAPKHPHAQAARNAKTNAAWKAAVIKYATAHGYSHETATNTVNHYLAGKPLNGRQGAVLGALMASTAPPPHAPKPQAHHAAPQVHKAQHPANKPKPAAHPAVKATAKASHKVASAPKKKK